MRTSIYTFVLLAGAVHAQSVILPDGLATVEGDTSHHVPGHYAPNRAQMIYRSSVLTGLGTTSIATLHLRRDGASAAAFAAHTWNVTLHMSSKGVRPPELACYSNFVKNQGSDWTTVLNAKPISFPATPQPPSPPAAFTVAIPLDSAFAYTSGDNLLLQWDCATMSSNPEVQPWFSDAQSFTGGDSTGTFTKLGNSCPPGTLFDGSVPGPLGGTLSWYWYSGVGPSVPAVGILGDSDKKWTGFNLPIDLTSIGAPGCSLYAGIMIVLPGMTDASGTNGRFRLDIELPCLAVLPGALMAVQSFVADPSNNKLGVRASQGGKCVLGPIPPELGALLLYSYDTPTSTGRINNVPMFASKLGIVLGIN